MALSLYFLFYLSVLPPFPMPYAPMHPCNHSQVLASGTFVPPNATPVLMTTLRFSPQRMILF